MSENQKSGPSFYDQVRGLFPDLTGDISESDLVDVINSRLNPEEEVSEEEVAQDLLHATELRNAAITTLKRFENQLLTASFSQKDSEDDDDEDNSSVSPVPEFLDEDKNRLRSETFDRLRYLFLESQKSQSSLSSNFYEAAVYDAVSDRIRRSLGYYQAISRSQEEIQRICSELGDPDALEVDISSIQKLLYGLDEVQFIRTLGLSLGVFAEDLDNIVGHVVRREFAPLRRREGGE